MEHSKFIEVVEDEMHEWGYPETVEFIYKRVKFFIRTKPRQLQNGVFFQIITSS